MEVAVPTPEEYKAYLDKNPQERGNIRCKYGAAPDWYVPERLTDGPGNNPFAISALAWVEEERVKHGIHRTSPR